jgi:thiamine-monophosphate kinase
MLLDGRHFDTSIHTIDQIINKVFAVNCSDIYAMGGIPSYASISLSLPPEFDSPTLAAAIKNAANKYRVTVIGGDTNSWEGKLVISMTLEGWSISAPILRNGAKPKDKIYVTGPLGGSLTNGRHLDPPNKAEAVSNLVERIQISSMIDLSDGLATDLRHILEASNVGAIIDVQSLPIHTDAKTIKEALCDGEDFELCFTLDENETKKLEAQNLIDKFGLVEIGEITNNVNLLQLKEGSNLSTLTLTGFEHN